MSVRNGRGSNVLRMPMDDCCEDKACEIDALRTRQSSVLKTVLGINAVMFLVELAVGMSAGSVSLVADSLDMLGDALVYGFSLYVVARSDRVKAFSALAKGCIMAAFGLFVLRQAIYKILVPHVPAFGTIGVIGLLALAANSLCFLLLWRHRVDDLNMSSVWLCSRNDIIANVSVLFAAVGVWLTKSGLPDVLIGLGLAILFLRSSYSVLHKAVAELRLGNA